MTSDGQALTGLMFDGETYFEETMDTQGENLTAQEAAELPAFAEAVRWLDTYFAGKEPNFLPPITLNTTPFRQEVCEIMQTIPYGQTMSYGQIADIIAQRRGLERMSAQAVGGAVGHNPISIIIPCHRVIGSDGSLTGYGGGLDKKVALLELEGVL